MLEYLWNEFLKLSLFQKGLMICIGYFLIQFILFAIGGGEDYSEKESDDLTLSAGCFLFPVLIAMLGLAFGSQKIEQLMYNLGMTSKKPRNKGGDYIP
jgi:hypothetical protein